MSSYSVLHLKPHKNSHHLHLKSLLWFKNITFHILLHFILITHPWGQWNKLYHHRHLHFINDQVRPQILSDLPKVTVLADQDSNPPHDTHRYGAETKRPGQACRQLRGELAAPEWSWAGWGGRQSAGAEPIPTPGQKLREDSAGWVVVSPPLPKMYPRL